VLLGCYYRGSSKHSWRLVFTERRSVEFEVVDAEGEMKTADDVAFKEDQIVGIEKTTSMFLRGHVTPKAPMCVHWVVDVELALLANLKPTTGKWMLPEAGAKVKKPLMVKPAV